MRKIGRITIGVLALQTITIISYSQNNLRNFEVGFNAGTYIYQGDLTPSRFGSWKTPAFGMMVFSGKRLTSNVSVRANLAYTKLRGDESRYKEPAYRQERNFNFKTRVLELSGMLVWEPLLRTNADVPNARLSPYVAGGIALSFLHVNRDWSNFNQAYFAEDAGLQNGLIADSEHKLPKVLPAIPVGLGVRYALTPKVDLHAESIYRFTRNDYVDGFSKSANPSRKDYYYSISAGLIFKFGKGEYDCPVVPK